MATKSLSLLKRVSYRAIHYRPVAPFACASNGFSPSTMATMATYKVPKVENENNVSLGESIEATV